MDRPKIYMLPFADKIYSNATLSHNESEEEEDDAETSGDDLDSE